MRALYNQNMHVFSGGTMSKRGLYAMAAVAALGLFVLVNYHQLRPRLARIVSSDQVSINSKTLSQYGILIWCLEVPKLPAAFPQSLKFWKVLKNCGQWKSLKSPGNLVLREWPEHSFVTFILHLREWASHLSSVGPWLFQGSHGSLKSLKVLKFEKLKLSP